MSLRRLVPLILAGIASLSCGGGGGDITVKSKVSSVSVSPPSTSIAVNGSTQLTATPLDAQGAPVSGVAVSWASNNPGIANVSTSGLVTGVAAGSASISASAGGATGTATVTVNPPSFAITATASPANGGTISGTGTFASGSSVTLTATANAGFTFTNWTENGAQVSANAGYTFTVTGARSLVANFAQVQTFTLTVTGGGTGNGTVTAPATAGQAAINCTLTAGVATGTCAGTYPSGTGLTLTATAAANHTFAGWSGGACAGTGTCVLTMTQARTVTASFTAPANDPCNPVALAFPGTVNGNVSAAGCVVNGLPAAIYRFTATGQGGSTFSATATFPVQISVMSDPPGSNIVFTGPAATPNSASFEWLLPPTSFQFKVASRTAGTGGTFSLTGSVTSGNSPSCPVSGTIIRAFVVGGTYSGQSLGAGDCTANDGSYEDGYYIYSTKPCTITMTPTGFDAFLAIYDASTGNNLTFSDNLGIGGAETVQLPACSNGGNALLIIANTFNAGETGTYVLAITITGGGSLTARDPGETVPALTPPLVHQDAATILQRLSLPKKKKN